MTKALSMDQLMAEVEIKAPGVGDILEGTVLSVEKHEIWLDLGASGTGVVLGRETESAVRALQPGDTISASVLDPETDEGYVVLSLRKVAKEKGWETLEERIKSGETFGVVPFDANRGGMLIEVDGIRGFLPVSQLSAENYPRVSGADKDEILQRLNHLVGQTLMVRVLDLDRKQNKLIVSEKAARREMTEGKLADIEVNSEVEGIVTGIVDFGVFVNVDGVEGMVHISEIAWDRVDNPSKYVKVGETVKAKVIAIDQDKLSLSMKQLSADPWIEESSRFSVGESVDGTINRITPFGAFVQITPVIEALVHISELSEDHVADPNDLVKVGEKKTFRVIAIDPAQHKLSLSLKPAKADKKQED
jgi:small subunit ribosomal protein S1